MFLQLNYNLSQEFLNSQYLKTGKIVNGGNPRMILTVSAEALTEEQRKLLLVLKPGINLSVSSVYVDMPYIPYEIYKDGSDFFKSMQPEHSSILTVDQWFDAAADCMKVCAEWEVKRRSMRKEFLQGVLDKRTAELNGFFVNRMVRALEFGTPVGQDRITEAKKLGCDFTEYDKIVAEIERMVPIFQAEVDARILKSETEKLQKEAEEKLARAKADMEKAKWIAEHGSEHLRACVGRGHNCQRLYVVERTKMELGKYGRYVIDFELNAEWNVRSCPSTLALAAALAIESELKLDAPIVWLTAEPLMDRDDGDYFEECEGIVVENYLGKYRVVFMF